ncbi:SCO family protein [Myxococcota bacterium]|nr:SCO family protein [Myxococcota bacterium]
MSAPTAPGPGPHTPMFERRWAWALFAVLVLGLPAFAVYWRTPPALEHYSPLPGFALVDQQGQVVTSLDLRGQVLLVDFIFTRCPDVCPLLSSKAAWLQRNLPAHPLGGAPIHILSLTVDPAHDRPEVLAEYAARYDADPARWSFLTGEEEQVRQVLADLQQVAELVDPGQEGEAPSIAHSERFLLVDAAGSVRGFYSSDEQGMLDLRRDALRLARSGGR